MAKVIIPKRAADSHKGDNGTVLIIGSSKDYVGAPALAGLAALRSGCDLVTIAAPEKVAYAINALSPDLITLKLKGEYLNTTHTRILLKQARKANVVVLGNGIGVQPGTKKLIKKLLARIKAPKVIDADALKAISLKEVENAILTPHKKELEILLSNTFSTSVLRDFKAMKLDHRNIKFLQRNLKNNVLLIKGQKDIIISKNKVGFNTTGNAGMTKGGTGDVLAGLCAGYIAQGLDLFQAAVNAAYYNGLAGDILLKKKKGFTYMASDLIEEINKIN